MPTFNKIAVVLATTLTATAVLAEDALNSHAHGSATLQLVLRKQELVAYLRGPAHDLVGFEHLAQSNEEKAQEQRLESDMRNPANWIELPAAAGCAVTRVHPSQHNVISNRGVAPEIGMAGNGLSTEHMDMNFTYHFHCTNPAGFNTARIKLFERFPSLETVHVKIAGDKQTRQELTRATPLLKMP